MARNRTQRGFTVIEIVLVVSLIAIMGAIAAPFLLSFQTRADLDIATNMAAFAIRRTATLAQGTYADVPWSVYIQSGSVTIYPGVSYGGHDPAYDVVFKISKKITVTGLNDIHLSRFTGYPTTAGTVTFTTVKNETKSISINARGMVQIQ